MNDQKYSILIPGGYESVPLGDLRGGVRMKSKIGLVPSKKNLEESVATIWTFDFDKPSKRQIYTSDFTLVRALRGEFSFTCGQYHWHLGPNHCLLVPSKVVLEEATRFRKSSIRYVFLSELFVRRVLKDYKLKPERFLTGLSIPLSLALNASLQDLVEESAATSDLDVCDEICTALIEMLSDKDAGCESLLGTRQWNRLKDQFSNMAPDFDLIRCSRARQLIKDRGSVASVARRLRLQPTDLKDGFKKVWRRDIESYAKAIELAKTKWRKAARARS